MTTRGVSFAVAVLAVVSCQKAPPPEQSASSASPAESAAPAATAPAQAASPCAIITPAEGAAAIGVATLSPPEVQSVPPVTICKFSDGKRPGALTVRFETGRSASDMPTIRKGHDDNGQPTADLPGLGEVAFKSS